MSEAKTEDLWYPYRDLFDTVNKHLTSENNDPSTYGDFEKVLRKCRQSFFSLLHNLPKNQKQREELKKGQEDGIAIKGIGHHVLSKELFQEVTIISDMYDMNEYVALDLLCTAQMQLPYFLDLPRGLVAIALYYDGRKYLVSTLRMLLQARTGVSWAMSLPPSIQRFINSYTDQLLENGLITRILELLKSMDLTKELELLQNNLALGGPTHRKQITDTFNSIKLLLADCLFILSCQSGLNKSSMLALIQHLKEVKLEEEASGKLDNVTLYLIMALTYGVDLSVLHTREDGEEVVQKLPILADPTLITTLTKELSPKNSTWQCEGLQAVAAFAFSVCLSSLRSVSQGQNMQNLVDQEDELIDAAIVMNVFDFMAVKFLDNDQFFQEEFMVKRVHHLFCDFVVQMYPKIKDLRLKADETAKTIQSYLHEGLELPANLSRYFESLLNALAKLYSKDPNKLELMMDYWCPIDSTHNLAHYRTHPRSVALFKFVRLAGDMLPPSLFVHYLNFLRALCNCQQGARNCFNMLKQPSGYNNTVSWDHFFMSFNQYNANLKQDLPPVSESIYRHSRLYTKGITPQEIEGLHAVLMLMKTVSDNDDFSRLALCEHPGWAPLNVLLGLVSCSIPIPLKADMLQVLASLAKSKEIAAQIWNNLETSQILVTIPSTSSYQPRGIQTELDEVESRLEEYPLTRAFLTLIDILTNSGIPRTLGAGPRQPGFDPYLFFIVNSVFLKFNSRNYKNPSEKWEIAALCIKLFDKFLTVYEPEGTDFPNINKQNEFNSPPGFHLMLQLHSKSELFNGLLFVINEGNKVYDACVPFPGEKHLDTATYHAMCIIDRCLRLQSKFFNLLTSSSSPVLLVNMHKLLLTLNPQSGRPDYILNIVKYLNYQSQLPKQCLVALKILRALTSSQLTHSQIMNILLSSNQEKVYLHGFVKCLDEVLDDENEYIALTKKEIFSLLHQCLPYNSPNLSQFLFGFDLQRDVSTTVFQLPGVLNTPRSCIHSLLTLLRHILLGRLEQDQSIIEECYHMLYSLCSNPKTADPVLRLIRSQQLFFKKHINYCHHNYTNGIHELNKMSWLLKTLAIELRLACCNKQIVNLKQITSVLVGLPAEAQPDFFDLSEKTGEPRTEDFVMTIEHLKQDNFLVKLIANFDLSMQKIVAPEWGFFDQNSLENYLAGCEQEGNPKLIDIKRLHRNLIEEITAAQGTTALGQRQAMMDELQKVLLHAVNINNSRKTAASTAKFVDAWRQVVQVMITYLPIEIIAPKDQVLLQIYLLDVILNKSVKLVLQPDVANYLSGTVMLLIENMRKSHIKDQKFNQMLFHDKQYDTRSMIDLNMPLVRTILNNLVQWIIISDNQSQKLRINLYAALATFLQLIHVIDDPKENKVNDSLYVSRLDNSKFRLQDEISSVYISSHVLSNFGEKLIDVFCYDCTGGQEICKMLALSCFSLLLGLSGSVNWIGHMAGRGYLKHIIESILKMDKDLRDVLEPLPESLKSIYLFDAKMSFLARIATTRIGSELLLEHKIFTVLSTMKVFDFHPELSKHLQDDDEDHLIMTVQQRYLQIWEPSLYLCNAMLTSLGTDHQAAVTQIINFLLNHLDVIELVLRSANPSLSLESLKEISMVTSIIARTANNDVLSTFDNQIVDGQPINNRSQLCRVQKLMLALVPKFILQESILRELLCDPHNEKASYKTSERLSYALEIIGNLLLYCRNIIQSNGIDHDSVGVVLQPTLNDSLLIGVNGANKKNYNDHSPSLGVVVQELINNVNYYHKERGTLDFLQRKENEIPGLDAVDLKEFGVGEGFDVSIMRDEALEMISAKLVMKKHDIDHCLLIIEHAMYIIWAHLNYYMLKAIPKAKSYGLNVTNSALNMNSTLASSSEAMWRVTTDDISNLKQGLVSIFNDSFCRRLIETSQGRSQADAGFMDVLLRKIKRLIQFVPVR